MNTNLFPSSFTTFTYQVVVPSGALAFRVRVTFRGLFPSARGSYAVGKISASPNENFSTATSPTKALKTGGTVSFTITVRVAVPACPESDRAGPVYTMRYTPAVDIICSTVTLLPRESTGSEAVVVAFRPATKVSITGANRYVADLQSSECAPASKTLV